MSIWRMDSLYFTLLETQTHITLLWCMNWGTIHNSFFVVFFFFGMFCICGTSIDTLYRWNKNRIYLELNCFFHRYNHPHHRMQIPKMMMKFIEMDMLTLIFNLILLFNRFYPFSATTIHNNMKHVFKTINKWMKQCRTCWIWK